MSRARRLSLDIDEHERRTLGEILAAIGDPEALADGRVFVDGRRQSDRDRVLSARATLDVYTARQSDEPVRILDERDGLVAAYKPAAIATEPDRQGARGSLVHEVARLLGVAPSALHALSRLDVGVSGVVLLARANTAPATSERCYVAIAPRAPDPRAGTWSSAIDGRDATTAYRVLAETGSGAALLGLEPVTGRTHQLRIHAERAGLPLYGDRAHGGAPRIVAASGGVHELDGIALHAIRVVVSGWQVVAPPPARLLAAWAALGGSADDWDQKW